MRPGVRTRNNLSGITIISGNSYIFNGIRVEVVGTGKMYAQNTDEWTESVIYTEQNPSGKVFRTVSKSYFVQSVVPVSLAVGNRLVAVSMGKNVAVYKVTEVTYNYVAAENITTGKKASFENEIAIDGKVDPVVKIDDDPQGTEYYFLTRELESRLRFNEAKEDSLNLLSSIKDMLSSSQIDYVKSDKSELDNIVAQLSDVHQRVKIAIRTKSETN